MTRLATTAKSHLWAITPNSFRFSDQSCVFFIKREFGTHNNAVLLQDVTEECPKSRPNVGRSCDCNVNFGGNRTSFKHRPELYSKVTCNSLSLDELPAKLPPRTLILDVRNNTVGRRETEFFIVVVWY